MTSLKERLFNRENKVKTYFMIIFSIISITCLITAIVLRIISDFWFFEGFLYYSVLNIVLSAMIIIIILMGARTGNYQPDFDVEDIINSNLSMKERKSEFTKLINKYVIKDDMEYLKLIKRLRIFDIITINVVLLVVITYPIIILLQTNISDLFINWELTLEPLEIESLLIGKLFIDVMIFITLPLIRNGRFVKKIWKKREELFPIYHQFLEKEIGVLSLDEGTLEEPGKGVTFVNELRIDPINIRNTTLSLEEEISILHQLAKYIVYRYQNYKDIILAGLVLGLQSLFILFLFNPEIIQVYLSIFIFATFAFIIGAMALVNQRANYIRLAKGVLGSRKTTVEEEEYYWQQFNDDSEFN